MLEEIEKNILSDFNGYCWNGFIFLLDKFEEKIFRTYLEKYLQEKAIALVFEHYNLKDVWWGSLSGMYLANITPPIVGFNSIEDLILHKKSSAVAEKNQFEKIMEQIENVQDGQI